jgi:hypothetical protein
LVLLVACYSPSPQPGSPCANGECPEPLICAPNGLCERSADVDAAIGNDAPVMGGCVPVAELCGDGVDQDCDGDDPACIANDEAAGAINITAGGMFTADLKFAHDNVMPNGCGGDGGRDIYYSIDLTAPRVYYFDTLGSSFDTVIRVFPRSCVNVGTGANARACQEDSCGGTQSQVAASLPAGQSCVVIDQDSAAETAGEVMLRVIAGSRDGLPLPAGMQTLTGDTSGASNVMDPVDVNCDEPGSNGRDVAYFFTQCPGTTRLLDAETCTNTAWDTVLYVRNGNTNQIACNDDACGALQTRVSNVSIANGVFFWLVLDAYDATHFGAYQLRTNLR